MTTTLVDIQVSYLEDTKERYAWTQEVAGAHAVGVTAQDAIANLTDLLPELMTLSKRTFASRSTVSTGMHISLPISYA